MIVQRQALWYPHLLIVLFFQKSNLRSTLIRIKTLEWNDPFIWNMFWLMKYSYHWKVLVWSKEFKLSRSNIDIVIFNDYTFDYMNDGAKVPNVIRHNFFRRILFLRKTKVFFIFLLNRYRIMCGQMLSQFAKKLCFFLKLVGIDIRWREPCIS